MKNTAENLKTNVAGRGAEDGLYPLAIGCYLLTVLVCCYAGAVFLFACGESVKPWLFPLALVSGGIAVRLMVDRRDAQKAIVIGLLTVAVSLVVATLLDDSSSDGIIYHQEMIVHILNGWNPFTTYIAGSADPDLELLVAHYAKGIEIMAAVVARCTGCIESGKLVNLLLLAGTYFVVYAVMVRRAVGRSRMSRVMLSLLLVANPVGMGQCLTYYNDFAGYYMILLLVAVCGYAPASFSFRQCLAAGAVIVMAAAVKFTAFFYCGVTVGAIMLWQMLSGRRAVAMRVGVTAFVTALAAVTMLCYHPYITNYLHAGHPCYPLMGEGAIDIMTGNTPEVFRGHNRFYNFWRSLFSVTMPAVAPGAGGFGPAGGIMLIIAGGVLVAGTMTRRIKPIYSYAAIWAFGACFVFEQSWWARYIPFFWLIPCCAAISVDRLGGCWRALRLSLVVLGLFSGAIYFASTFYRDLQLTYARYYAYRLVGDDTAVINGGLLIEDGEIISRGVMSVERHLNEHGKSIIDIAVARHSSSDVVPVAISSFYSDDSKVELYFPSSRRKEIREFFIHSIPSRLLRLNNFVPSADEESPQ